MTAEGCVTRWVAGGGRDTVGDLSVVMRVCVCVCVCGGERASERGPVAAVATLV